MINWIDELIERPKRGRRRYPNRHGGTFTKAEERFLSRLRRQMAQDLKSEGLDRRVPWTVVLRSCVRAAMVEE